MLFQPSVNWRSRLSNGVTAFLNAYFNPGNFVPMRESGWDTYEARLTRYYTAEHYLNNSIYEAFNTLSTQLKMHHRLYKNIRGIYNPVARQNELLVAFIYGGALDLETMTGGALPIKTDNPALLDALRKLLIWSRFGEQKSLYVRWGAALGDVALKVIDDRAAEKVRLEVLHPGKIREAELDEVGNVTSCVIEYERDDELDYAALKAGRYAFAKQQRQRKSYVYTEVITKEYFATFRDGEPYAYFDGLTEWENEYGFVPLVLAHHQQLGLTWGGNAWRLAQRKIDEVNDQASLLNDQIRKIIIPLLQARGIANAGQLSTSSEGRDGLNILYLPDKDTSLEAITTSLDIAGASSNVVDMLREIERDMPELALQRIREQGQLTAPGVRSGYSDALGRIEEACGNYDHALIRAMQMAVSMGGQRNYRGFEPFSLNSYDAGDLDMVIRSRPIIPDSLSLSEQLSALGAVGGQTPQVQRLSLQLLDYDESTINAVLADREAQMRAELREFSTGLFEEDDLPEDEDAEFTEDPA
jgi:hypothetical protein